MEISESLKRFRQKFKLNQREIAAALNIPYQSYQGYEYGRNIPSAKIIANLADIYNVSADYLLGRTDNPSGLQSASNAVTEEDIKQIALAFSESSKALEKVLAKQAGA